MTLPVFKGDVFHRLLGSALNRVSPTIGRYFFKPDIPGNWPDKRQTPPKPFLLHTASSDRTEYQQGDILDVGITLFGQAQLHLPVLFAALEQLGASTGLGGNGRGTFQVERMDQIMPHGDQEIFNNGNWSASPVSTTAADVFQTAPLSTKNLLIHTRTPLQIKTKGRVLRHDLGLEILTDRLLGRVNTLSAMYCGGLLLAPDEKMALVTLARAALPKQDNTRWREWPRINKQKKMKLCGLGGQISFSGVASVLLPWLSLGQWTGVGGKTSFGLGSYSMEIEPCTN